jgi:YfiH family protein
LFRKNDRQIYRSALLEELPWVEHGFGTRASGDWAVHAATVKQIHSNVVLKADASAGRLGEGDALITNHPGTMLAVRTADCVPILLADEKKHAVAAVHAGWRGTVSGVVVKAVEAMGEHFASDPRDIWAAIGPGIGRCCYEVGPEVAAQFQGIFPEQSTSGSTAKVDLTEANRRLLIKAGVRPLHIVAAQLCTFCGASEFHSWRRDRTSERMVSAIGVKLP